MEYTVKEVRPKIILLSFDSRYDLAMHFLRFQEYYESPHEAFKGKLFNLVDYMEWYSKEYGEDSFTYPDDWSGFNVPSWVLHDVVNGNIPDFNRYDGFMTDLYWKLAAEHGPSFYLIGARTSDEQTLQHEIAHGFWYTTPEYKLQMQKLVDDLEPQIKEAFRNALLDNNYCEDVVDDEIHAYLSTGLAGFLKDSLKEVEGNPDFRKPFIKLFKKYYKMPV